MFRLKSTRFREGKILTYLYLHVMWKAINPMNKNYILTFAKKHTKESITYVADGAIDHGGVSDRYKGILSSFYLANKHELPFQIFYISPVEYRNFWESENINISKIYVNPFRLKIWFVPSLDRMQVLEQLKRKDFENKNNLLYLSENILAYMHDNGEWEKKTRSLHKKLNKLGKNHIKEYLKERCKGIHIDQIRIIHMRCFNYFGDFADSNLPALAQKKKLEILQRFEELLKRRYGDLASYAFVSDSRYATRFFKDNGYRVFGLEQTKHLDNPGHSLEEYRLAYAENQLISLAKSIDSYVLHYENPKPMNSHYAYYASIYNKVPYRKFSFNLKNHSSLELRAEK